jgi:hypothetical protein
MNPIDEKLKILQPVLGTQKAKKLRQMYLFEDDFRAKKEIENRIDLLIAQYVKREIEDEIILPPPDKNLCSGDINLGTTEYLGRKLDAFDLKLKDINRHVGIFGSTGSGKTTIAKNMIRQLHKKKIPYLIFDWEKSYRNLTREFKDVQVFTVGNDINPIFLNFLTVPPGIKFDEYIKSIIAVISEDYIGGIGADTMLLEYMEMAFQETKNPFFADLKHIIVREITKDRGRGGKLAGRSGLWKETVSRQISFLSRGAAGTIINPRKHFPIEQLFSKPIILEFGNLKSVHDRKFFIHVILNWLSIYNQHCGILSEKLKQVLIFEEFHNIAMKGKEDNMVSCLFRESRKYGIGLVAIDQTPSEIPNSIFANMNAKISFSLGTSQDITSMAKAMNLDRDKSRFLGMLNTGQAIVNVKQRHHDSFLLNTPFVREDENVWDEELRSAMKKVSKDSHLNPSDIMERSSPHLPQDKDTSPPMLSKPNITGLEMCLLSDISEHQFDGVDARSKRLGLHPAQMSDLHTSLSEKGILMPVQVGNLKLFEITTEGRTMAEKAGIKIKKQNSRGGIEHSFAIHQTSRHLTNLELRPLSEIGGIDIVDATAGLAIEIETGKSNIPANLLKLEKSGFDHLFMLATNKMAEFKIKAKQPDFPAIQFMHIKDFLKLSIDQIMSQSHPDNEVSAITK